MRDSDGSRDQVGIQRVPSMFGKKLAVHRKQTGIEMLQNAGQINFGIFGIRVISVNEQGGYGQRQQREDGSSAQCGLLQLCLAESTQYIVGATAGKVAGKANGHAVPGLQSAAAARSI